MSSQASCPWYQPFKFSIDIQGRQIQGCSNYPASWPFPVPGHYEITFYVKPTSPLSSVLEPATLPTLADYIKQEFVNQMEQQGHTVTNVQVSVNYSQNTITISFDASSPPITLVLEILVPLIILGLVVLGILWLIDDITHTSAKVSATPEGWAIIAVAGIGATALLIFAIKAKKGS